MARKKAFKRKRLLVSVSVGALVLVVLVLTGGIRVEWKPKEVVDTLDSPLKGKYFKEAFGGACFDGSCRITYSTGGDERVFRLAAEEVLAGYAEEVQIDGRCYSGCVLFADHARQKVCLTSKAEMYVHKAWQKRSFELGRWRFDLTIYSDPSHSKDVNEWVYRTKGGYPYDGFAEMDTNIKKITWKQCFAPPRTLRIVNVPLPRPDPRKSSAAK